MTAIPAETSFFRDASVFAALREQIFPELLRRYRLERRLNLWCAACSTGQEAYSLAMLLHEAFPVIANTWNLQILASDVSDERLARARAGAYSDLEIERRLPPRLLRRYFERLGNEWVVSDEIRLMVQFRRIDLCQPLPPIQPVDGLFLRNVLIYFDRRTRADILQRIRSVLKPDGYLFLGKGETLQTPQLEFQTSSLNGATFYQRCDW